MSGFARQTVAPYAEPIHLDEAKNQVKGEGITADDALLKRLIRGATRWAEHLTGLQLVVAQWQAGLPSFAGRAIELPHGPVLSVDSVTYLDTGGARQTVSTSDYQADVVGYPHLLYPAYNASWPGNRVEPNSVQVNYTSGIITPFTADEEERTAKGRTLEDGELVRLSNSGGALPAGLEIETDYYVVDVSGGTFGLSLTEGGTAISTTTAGTGLHFIGVLPGTLLDAMLLKIGERYMLREDAEPKTDRVSAADALLLSEWTGAL